MNQGSVREKLRWKHKPFPELARLAWPIAVSMLSYSVMTLVDALFVGRLGDSALAAVGLGGITFFTVVCFGLGLLRGGKITVAQAVGRGDFDRVAPLTGALLVLALAFGSMAALVGQAVAVGMPWLAVDEHSGSLARVYVAVRALAAPIPLAAAALREVRYAVGDSRSPMRAALIANVVNVPLDALFIFGCDLGVAGAAIATAAAQVVELSALAIAQRERGFGLSAWRRRDLTGLWRLGAPVGLERLLDVGSFSVMVALFARMSTTDLAAHYIAIQVLHFSFLPAFAVGEAVSVLSGQAVGAGQDAVLPRVVRGALALNGGYMLLCSAVFVAAGPALVSAFTDSGDVIATAVELLWMAAVFVPFHGVYMVLQGALRGTGDVRFTAVVAVVSAWVCTPSLAALLGLRFGLGALGGWIGLTVEILTSTALLSGRYALGGWRAAAERSRRALAATGEPPLAASTGTGAEPRPAPAFIE